MYYKEKGECRMGAPPFTAPKIDIFPAPESNMVNDDDDDDDGYDCDDDEDEDGDDNVDDVVVVVGDCNSIQQCL